MDRIKIALIDDQRLFREGLAAMLKSVDDFDMLAVHENGNVFLHNLQSMPERPHIAIVDMSMPEINGVDLSIALQRDFPEIKIIILTVYNQEVFIHKMVKLGVSGYLLKNCDIEEVITAIRSTFKTGFYFNEAVLKALKNSHKYKSSVVRNTNNIPILLSDREAEVLQLICKEFTTAEIGEQMHISARTVDGHRNNLLLKTGCRNTAGLVLFAVSNGVYNAIYP